MLVFEDKHSFMTRGEEEYLIIPNKDIFTDVCNLCSERAVIGSSGESKKYICPKRMTTKHLSDCFQEKKSMDVSF